MGPNHRLGRSSTSKRTRYRIHLGRLHINRKMCRNPAGEECASVPSADISHWPLPVCLSCLPKRLSGLQLSIKHPIPVSPRPRKARPPPRGRHPQEATPRTRRAPQNPNVYETWRNRPTENSPCIGSGRRVLFNLAPSAKARRPKAAGETPAGGNLENRILDKRRSQ